MKLLRIYFHSVGSAILCITIASMQSEVSAFSNRQAEYSEKSWDAHSGSERPAKKNIQLSYAENSDFSNIEKSKSEKSLTLQNYIESEHYENITKRKAFRILQFGDSHTAGDFFSGELRSSLKKRFGDSGIGWIIPVSLPGQRSSLYDVKKFGSWANKYQKSRTDNVSLPVGGYSAIGSSGSQLSVVPTKKLRTESKVQFSALVRAIGSNETKVSFRVNNQSGVQHSISKRWQLITDGFNASEKNRYDFLVNEGQVEVAALFIDLDKKGVTVEAIGRNGGELFWLKNWSRESINILFKNRPVDLVVLEYGTNEAVDFIESRRYFLDLQYQVDRLHEALPGVPIVIISVPSFAKHPNTNCRQPPSLMQIHTAQKHFAEKSAGVLTWSWLESMGGPCAVQIWKSKGLMASDWIHFSTSGYKQSANLFTQWLLKQMMW